MSKHIRFDWAIKRLLRQKANFDVLEGFLSELLKFDVKIEEIIESEGNQEYENDKFNRVDLLAKNTNNELILIEVQNERQHDYFHRMNYAQAKLITEHIDLGDKYAKVKKVFSINIVYFELGQGEDYVYVGKTNFKGLHQNDELQLSETQKELYSVKNLSELYANYYIIKTNNFNDIAKDSLDEWIYFLKNNEIKEEFKAKGIQAAKKKLRVDNLAGKEKENYDNFVKYQRIRESEIDTAVYDGLKKLKAELKPQIEKERRQKEEERRQKEDERNQKEEALNKIYISAKQMKKIGMPADAIMKATGLSKEDIEKL